MTRKSKTPPPDILDAAFADLRASGSPPSQDLIARILADAADMAPTQPDTPAGAGSASGWFANLLDGIGGWRGGAALTASAVLGLTVGLSGLSGDLLTDTTFATEEAILIDGYSGLFDDTLSEG